MNDKLILPDIAFNATGKCTLQYTDPITGKVLFENSGENHVFTKQLAGLQNFQSTALSSELLLCQGGVSPGDDIPVVPGDLIGFGTPRAEGSGTMRGTYREADSYYNKRSLAKVSNKYVYDFLQTQALGRVDWVGLSSVRGNGDGLPNWRPPHQKNYPTSYDKVLDLVTNTYYRAATSSSTLYLYYNNNFTMSSERAVDLSGAFGTFYSGYAKVCVDSANNRVYMLAYYKQSSSGAYLSRVAVMKEDLSGYESVVTVTSGGSYIQYGTQGGVYNNKVTWLYASNYTYFTVYTLDLETLAVTSETKYPPTNKNRITWTAYNTYVYKNCIWPETYYEAGNYDYAYTTPMVDIETREIYTMLPPAAGRGNSKYYYYHGIFCPYKAHLGQWASFYYDGDSTGDFCAYTRYQVPAEVPDRPEGMGMTVTYELEIEW